VRCSPHAGRSPCVLDCQPASGVVRRTGGEGAPYGTTWRASVLYAQNGPLSPNRAAESVAEPLQALLGD